MSDEHANRDEDELLSQIDELKARMDRLMSGGTSTSNSALLTDEAKPDHKSGEGKLVDRPADPAPSRTRVRDLIGPDDVETVENYTAAETGIPFPTDADDGTVLPADVSDPEPEPVRSTPVGGSVINVERQAQEHRPMASTFEDIGSAVEEELAKDASVPTPEAKKGPDLASRFGPADESVVASDPPQEVLAEDPDEVEEAVVDDTEEFEADEDFFERAPSRSFGKVAVVWAVTAIASGALATLHFAGII